MLKKILLGLLLVGITLPRLAYATDTTNSTRYSRLRAQETELGASGFIDFGEDPFDKTQEMTLKTLFGTQSDKIEFYSNEAELSPEGVQYADMDMFYWHLVDPHWALKGGANYFYRPTSSTPYWQPGVGVEGTTPVYPLDTNVRVYLHESSVKLDAEFIHDFDITDKFFIKGSIRGILATSSVPDDQIGNGLNQMRYFVRPSYRLTKELNLFVEYEYLQDYGSTANFREEEDEEAIENLVLFGLAVDF